MSRLTNFSVAIFKNEDDKPREPPPPATPLDFPCCKPIGLPMVDFDNDCSLRKTFTNILRTGPSKQHVEALNISLVDDFPLEKLIQSDFIPPLSWSQDVDDHEHPNAFRAESSRSHNLSNGAPAPSRKVYFDSFKELIHDNEDAFRAIKRDPPLPDRKHPRIVHFRKFWEGLMLMAEYWDTSCDNYIESKEGKENEKVTMDIDDLRSEAEKSADEVLHRTAKDEKKTTYTGRRTDTGRSMPGKFREDTVFAFVETLSWAFRCRLEHPKIQPRVKLQGMILPLPHAGSVYRQPRDRLNAKAGILEGPMMGVFCRDQHCFRKPEEGVGEGKTEVLDLLRETGLALMLAQKRAREGREEEIPGQGKWWANTPRWGGGPGGEAGLPAEEEAIEYAETSSDGQRKRVRKGSKVDSWRIVRPPSATWEKNVTYLQIGKEKGFDYDDVSHNFLNTTQRHSKNLLTTGPDLPHLLPKPPYIHSSRSYPHRLHQPR